MSQPRQVDSDRNTAQCKESPGRRGPAWTEVAVEPLPEGSNSNWADPGVYEVAAGVYRIPLPLPNDALRAVNVYAITDGTNLVLVDSGWALTESRQLLADALKAIDAELGDVREFLITHVHRDHYTQAVALRREFGNRIALGKLEQPSLDASANPNQFPMQAQLDLLRLSDGHEVITALSKLFGSEPRHTEANLWEEPDEWLTPGRRAVLPDREFDVVHTPGHTNGHVVFVDGAANLLFSGDHVLPHITPSIGFQPVPAELPLNDYLDSLRLVRGMPDRRMLPASRPSHRQRACPHRRTSRTPPATSRNDDGSDRSRSKHCFRSCEPPRLDPPRPQAVRNGRLQSDARRPGDRRTPGPAGFTEQARG